MFDHRVVAFRFDPCRSPPRERNGQLPTIISRVVNETANNVAYVNNTLVKK